MSSPLARPARRVSGLLLAVCVSFSSVLAQDDPRWIRFPAISPDGSAIVFTYRGDLFRVPATGGEAIPLTSYVGDDRMPVFSRDGRNIAFASDRTGNLDVWIMPATGGTARRLTYHSADDLPWSFTPDGEAVIFSSARLDAPRSSAFPRLGELYRVPSAGGRVDMVLTTPAEAVVFDSIGSRMLYQDAKGYEDIYRKHHTSSITRDLWLYEPATGVHRQLTTLPGDDLNSVFTPDGEHMVYLSAQGSGVINVVRAPLADPGLVEPLTAFEVHPVRHLTSADDGTLAFSWDGALFTLQPGSQPRRVPVRIAVDRPDRGIRPIDVTSGATEMAVSPGGKEVAFVHRGEVFVTSVESAVTKQVTSTPEQERSVSFSPDGRSLVYASERDGSWNLYRSDLREGEKFFFNGTVFDEKPVLVTGHETFQPAFSPDGKEVAFLEDRESLKVLNLESGAVRTILPDSLTYSYADGDQYFTWSPDGRWFLVQYLQPGYWSPEVGLARADGTGEIVNLTRSGYPDGSPRWAAKGTMMTWISSRDGLRSAAGSGSTESDVYGMFFTEAVFDRFRLSKEEFDLLEEAEKEARKGASKEDDKKEDDKDLSKPDGPIVIDFAGLQERTTRLTIHSSRLSDAVVTHDAAKLLYITRFEKDYALWQTDLRTRETKQVVSLGSSGGSLELSRDGKYVFVLGGGKISRIQIESGKQKSIDFHATLRLDPDAERAYLFEHAWRQVREKFLVRDLHGASWDSLKTAYQRYVPHVGTDREFADMLSELLGELNASHTGARFRSSLEGADATASLGFVPDDRWRDDGLRVAEVFTQGPLDRADSKVVPGVVLTAIDGVPLTVSENVASRLDRLAGRNVRLTFRSADGATTWDETVKPVSFAAEGEQVYRRWVTRRREMTDSLSGGRIGYVHIRGMNDGSYRTVVEEVMGRHVTREAIVIDTRYNGGGDLVDDVVTFFSGTHYSDFVAPDGQLVGSESQRRWTRPSIMLVAEGNYSDAHCTPWAYRYLKIGKLVGTPVPGTCSFVWWEGMQNGVVFGIPNMAMTDGPGGPPLENRQLEPDILVRNAPADVARGRDAQLEAAVTDLLDQLNGN